MSKKIITIIICAILSSFVFIQEYKEISTPQELYKVYLAGKTIGYVSDKEKLEEYIDETQGELKEKYRVDKVYAPNDLKITKEITYNKTASSHEVIYEEIKDLSPFTINGYEINISKVESGSGDGEQIIEASKIYVLDRKIFEEALKNTVMVFVSDIDYNNFINGTQKEIQDTGSIIEDIYIKNKITIKEDKISTEEKIFTDVESLSQYLIFGTNEKQKEYTVKSGDTIKDIAFDNKLSVSEFLIANSDLNSENNLLYEGQKVNIGLINPKISLVEEDHVVELQTKKYDTKIEYDSTMLSGYEKVKQNGSDGTVKVTKKVQKSNGEIISAVITKTEEVKPSIPKIIVKGSKVVPSVGNIGVWRWPTNKPYIITSTYSWRWGKLHEGLDISGTGYGSPIYAANNGVVEVASYTSINGNYIYINHNNGYYSVYAHMAKLNVKVGQVVEMGTVIGTMGNSGYVVPAPTAAYPTRGTHLHFAIYKGYPYRSGTYSVNPMNFYK